MELADDTLRPNKGAAGKHDDFNSYTTGIDGEKRGVYYYQLDSGWYSIITIPYSELLESSNKLRTIFLIVLILFFLMLILVDYHTNKKAKLYNEIVGVLSNSYYALYLIDLEHNQYSMLKAPDIVRSEIPQKGSYDVLLHALTNMIHEKDLSGCQNWQKNRTTINKRRYSP